MRSVCRWKLYSPSVKLTAVLSFVAVEDSTKPAPYKSDLGYLEDNFQVSGYMSSLG